MTAFEAETLARQLAQLGRDLDAEVGELSELEHGCVGAESLYRVMTAGHQKALDEAYLSVSGTVEDRKAHSRLKAATAQALAEEAWRDWQDARADVRMKEKSISALGKRIDIGRSLLSREKALLSLGGIGEVLSIQQGEMCRTTCLSGCARNSSGSTVTASPPGDSRWAQAIPSASMRG